MSLEYLPYPLIFWWTSAFIPYLTYCEPSWNKQGVRVVASNSYTDFISLGEFPGVGWLYCLIDLFSDLGGIHTVLHIRCTTFPSHFLHILASICNFFFDLQLISIHSGFLLFFFLMSSDHKHHSCVCHCISSFGNHLFMSFAHVLIGLFCCCWVWTLSMS